MLIVCNVVQVDINRKYLMGRLCKESAYRVHTCLELNLHVHTYMYSIGIIKGGVTWIRRYCKGMCSAWASRLISGNHAYATAAHAGLAGVVQ